MDSVKLCLHRPKLQAPVLLCLNEGFKISSAELLKTAAVRGNKAKEKLQGAYRLKNREAPTIPAYQVLHVALKAVFATHIHTTKPFKNLPQGLAPRRWDA